MLLRDDGGRPPKHAAGNIIRMRTVCFVCAGAVELHLSGLFGTASHPDMQNIRIIGVLFRNRLHWQFEVERISTSGCFRLHVFYVQIKF